MKGRADTYDIDSIGLLDFGSTLDAATPSFQNTFDPGTGLGAIVPGLVLPEALIGGTSRLFKANNMGVFTYGDGSDGAAYFDGASAVTGASRSGSTYTLTRDVYYTDMTVLSGVTVKPAGYRIFGLGTLTNYGTIERNGNAGGNASGTTGGAAGAALADGYLKGSVAGKAGADGASGSGANGNTGTNTSNSLGGNGSAGGDSGRGSFDTTRGTGGAGGTATASNVTLIANWHLLTLLDITVTGATLKFDNSAGAGSGAGGGGNGASAGRGGGGSGSSGGIIAIYFRSIVNGGTVSADGGAGGNGGTVPGGDFVHGAGGGGAGGRGGQIILVYNAYKNTGTLSVAGGAAGAGGTSDAGGNFNGANGTAGGSGTVREFQVAL